MLCGGLFWAVFVEQSLGEVLIASLLVTESLNKSIIMLTEAVRTRAVN